MAKAPGYCNQKCVDQGLQPGTPAYRDCMQKCQDKEEETPRTQPPVPPCKGSGYLGKQIKQGNRYLLMTPCKEGYKPVKAEDGRIWCCKISNGTGDGTNGTDENGTGQPCAGGYKLADDPVMPQGGSIWTDNYITPEMGFMRNPGAQAEWIYKDGKWYNQLDVHNAIKNGTLDNLTGTEGYACKKFFKRTMINGEEWCCPDPKAKEAAGPTGEFKWSDDMLKLIGDAREMLEYLLKYKRGTTPEERQAIINYAIDSIRKGERGQIQSLKDQMARIGIVGQPYEVEKLQEIRRGTGEKVAGVEQAMTVDELDRRFRELTGTAGLAQQLLTALLGTEQIPEVLSSARRQEGMDLMGMLLNYLSMNLGGGTNYWQAILNYIMQQQGGGGGIEHLLPYLAFF